MITNYGFLLSICLVSVIVLSKDSQFDGYYDGIDESVSNNEFSAALSDLISDHSSISYQKVWDAFLVLDVASNAGRNHSGLTCKPNEIIGIYERICWSQDNTCGNFKAEGDCFNREHTWAKSWWGGESVSTHAISDLHHLLPTDGFINQQKGSKPVGYVAKDKVWVRSGGGAKIGPHRDQNTYRGPVFEPADEYKGDIARAYFYMSLAYKFKCCDDEGVTGNHIKPWMEKELREWHKNDPVSDKEVNRNQMIYAKYQHNRNPFIDHPEWVDKIAHF